MKIKTVQDFVDLMERLRLEVDKDNLGQIIAYTTENTKWTELTAYADQLDLQYVNPDDISCNQLIVYSNIWDNENQFQQYLDWDHGLDNEDRADLWNDFYVWNPERK